MTNKEKVTLSSEKATIERTVLITIENTQYKTIKRTLHVPAEFTDEVDIVEYIYDNGLAEDDEEY